MSGKLYLGKLNITEIEKVKDQAFKGKNDWLDVAIWVNDEPDQYGNELSVQFGKKGEQKHYLGNAKAYQKEEAPF